MKRRIIQALLAGLLILSGCSAPVVTTDQGDSTQHTDELSRSRVQVDLVQAIDGDTIKVMYNGKEENVRFLLVDTPETNHARLGVQPFGPEAKAFTKELVENAKRIELEFDIGPQRDQYLRLLAYVYADDVMVQEALLAEGLARAAYIYEPNVRYVDKFNELQRVSRNQGVGIWSIENYAQEDGFHPEEQSEQSGTQEVHPATPSTAQTGSAGAGEAESSKPASGCSIKGNINSRGEKIYHTPESPSYKQTVPEQWFCNESEAEAAGFRAPR